MLRNTADAKGSANIPNQQAFLPPGLRHSFCYERSTERHVELLPHVDHRSGKHIDE